MLTPDEATDVLSDLALGGPEKYLYTTLLCRTLEEPEESPSLEDLALEMKRSVGTIRGYVNELKDLGLLQSKRRMGRSAVYSFPGVAMPGRKLREIPSGEVVADEFGRAWDAGGRLVV